MSLVKRLGKMEALRGFLCWLGAWYIRLVFATTRFEVIGADIPARYWDNGKPFIFAFWHGRLLLLTKLWPAHVPVHMLISQHRDGQLIARTIHHFGIRTIAGSSTRGGAEALRALLKALKAGECVGITPDGPKGPRMHASDGVISLARLSGCPIIPGAYAVTHRRVLGSWDRFVLALPFGKGVMVWGRPIEVAKDCSAAGQEALRDELEQRLNALTIAADSRMGVVPVEPAEIAPEILP